MAATGPARRPPTRTCVACRTSREKRELVRIVRQPDGSVRIDATGRAAGRGAYVCRDAACIDNVTRRGALGRALETAVPAGLGNELAALIAPEGGSRGQE